MLRQGGEAVFAMLGVWMWPESLRLRRPDDVFEALLRAGVTDIFFLTKGLNGTTAFLTPSAPSMEPGRDLFREALEGAHRRGMRLHAWFTSASDRNYLKDHPASGLCHFKKGPSGEIVDMTDPGYRVYLSGLLEAMLREYDPDGVHLDYIRYNHLLSGWSEADRRRYAEAGADVGALEALLNRTFYGGAPEEEAVFDAFRAGDPDVLALAEVRRRNVTGFARELTGVARSSGRELTLSMALMPEGAFDDLAFSDLHYGQHYGDLSGIADLFLPMAYSRAYGKGPVWVREAAEGTLRHGVKTLVGIQAYEGGTAVQARDDIRAAEASGAEGVCLFREGGSVWAFREGGMLTLVNPLPRAVSVCRVTEEGTERTLETPVGPRQEASFAVSGTPDGLHILDEAGQELPAVCFGM